LVHNTDELFLTAEAQSSQRTSPFPACIGPSTVGERPSASLGDRDVRTTLWPRLRSAERTRRASGVEAWNLAGDSVPERIQGTVPERSRGVVNKKIPIKKQPSPSHHRLTLGAQLQIKLKPEGVLQHPFGFLTIMIS
jgi:hypothetical protein